MKSLYQKIGTAVVSATLGSGCALLPKRDIRSVLKDAYGCVGETKPVRGIRDANLARSTLKNRMISDYKRLCPGMNTDRLGEIRDEYDEKNNVFLTYFPNK